MVPPTALLAREIAGRERFVDDDCASTGPPANRRARNRGRRRIGMFIVSKKPSVTGDIVTSMWAPVAATRTKCVQARPSALNSAELAAATPGVIARGDRGRCVNAARCSAGSTRRTVSTDASSRPGGRESGIDAREPRERHHEGGCRRTALQGRTRPGSQRMDASRRRVPKHAASRASPRRIGATLEARRAGTIPIRPRRKNDQRRGDAHQTPVRLADREESDRRMTSACRRPTARPPLRSAGRGRRTAIATRPLSTSSCSIEPRASGRRSRSRNAISSLACRGARPNRLATLEPAISRISAAIAARIHSGRSNCRAERRRTVASRVARRAECSRSAALCGGLRPHPAAARGGTTGERGLQHVFPSSSRTPSWRRPNPRNPPNWVFPNARGLYMA